MEFLPTYTAYDECYNSETNRLFHEVIVSFFNSNYRAAIVSLYSVVIVDVLIRLNELSDIYEEKCARTVLNKARSDMECVTKNSKGNVIASYNSKWEGELLNSANNDVHLFDQTSWLSIRHLAELRNQCAHPSMDDDFKLLSPSKETAFAVINDIYHHFLKMPSLLIARVTDTFVESLKQRRSIYSEFYDGKLKQYLIERFYSKMTFPVKLKTFYTLWKLAFDTNNEECLLNRDIYHAALDFLLEFMFGDKERLVTEISNTKDSYSVLLDSSAAGESVILLLSKHPYIYNVLSVATKDVIDRQSSTLDNMLVSWFRFDTVDEFLLELKSSIVRSAKYGSFTEVHVSRFVAYLSEFDRTETGFDLLIQIYSMSDSFAASAQRCMMMIYPYLKEFTKQQILNLLKCIDSNSQIYKSWGVLECNKEIVKRIHELGIVVNIEDYPQFYSSISQL